MKILWFSLLFFSLQAEPESIKNMVHHYTTKYTVDTCHYLDGSELFLHWSGKMLCAVAVQKTSKEGLPEKVQLTIEKMEGSRSDDKEEKKYSSDLLPAKGRTIHCPFDRAASDIVGSTLVLQLLLDPLSYSIRVEDDGTYAELIKKNPRIAEVCPLSMIECFLQRIFAPAFSKEKQLQLLRVAKGLHIPVDYTLHQELQNIVTASYQGDVAKAHSFVSKPLEGELFGRASWKREDLLCCLIQERCNYKVQLEGKGGYDLCLALAWFIKEDSFALATD